MSKVRLPRLFLCIFDSGEAVEEIILKTIMETTKLTKDVYLKPELEIIQTYTEGIFCTSPGGGGTEGTEDEPLFPYVITY